MAVRLHDVERVAGGFGATVTYRLGDRSWEQRFTAHVVDDDELASPAFECDLVIRGTLDDAGARVVLETGSRGVQ